MLVWTSLDQVKYRFDLRWLIDHEAWQWWAGAAVLAVGSAVVGWFARRSAALLWPVAAACGIGAVQVCVPDPVFRVLSTGALLSVYVAAQAHCRPGVPADGRVGRLVSMLGWLALGGAGLALAQAMTTWEGPATGLTDVTVGIAVLTAFAVVHLAAGWWLRREGRGIACTCCAAGVVVLAAVLTRDGWRAGAGEALDTVSAEFELAAGLTASVGVAFLLATWGWTLLACQRPGPGPVSRGGRGRGALGVAAVIVAAIVAGAGAVAAPRFLGPVAARIDTQVAAYTVGFHPDGHVVAVAGGGRGGAAVELWDVPGRRRIATLDAAADSDGIFTSVAFSGDGKFLAAAGYHSLGVWEVATQSRIALPAGEVRGMWRVAFSGDNRTLAVGEARCGTTGGESCGTVHTVSLWDVAERRKVTQLPTVDPELTNLRFSPDSRMLLTEHHLGTAGGTRMHRWDVTTGRPIGEPLDNVTAGGFTPDGRLLALGGERAQLYDVATGQPVGAPFGDTGIRQLAFRPGSNLMAAAHRPDPRRLGSYVQLWDVTTRRRVGDRIPPARTGTVKSLAFTPDGQTLAVVDGGRTVRLWNVGRYGDVQ